MDTRFLEVVRTEKIRTRRASIDMAASWFMVAWVVILLQGAIRKWVVPGFSLAYFLEDIPILIAYMYAFSKGVIWVGGLLYFSIAITLLLCFQSLLQIIVIHYNYLAALIALHHFVFYLPMLFFLPACMTRQNIQKFLRLNLLSIIPMTMIALVQAVSPRASWINQTAGGDDIGKAFGVSGDIARTSGTFNFTLPFSIWCGIAAALVLGEWLLPPARRTLHSRTLLIVISVCSTLSVATSGSRTAIFLAAIAFIGAIITVILTRNLLLLMRFVAIIVIIPIFLGLAFLVAPNSINALIGRFTKEGAKEEMTSRIISMSIGFLLYPDFDLVGHGIGEGMPGPEASTRLVKNDPYWRVGVADVSEWDNIRVVQELGNITGVIVVLARYGAGFLLMTAAFKALLLPAGESWPHAIPLAFTLLPTLVIGDMVHSAPVDAPMMYYSCATIMSALLYRRESFSSVQLSQIEAR